MRLFAYTLFFLSLLVGRAGYGGPLDSRECYGSEFCVAVTQKSSYLSVTVESLLDYPITLTVEQTLENLSPLTELAPYYEIEARGTQEVERLTVVNPSKSVDYSFNFYRSIGNPVDAATYAYRVQSMYVAYYGRAGDFDGVAWWVMELANRGGELSSMINAFGKSPEYEDRFGALTTQELITNLYEQMFGRLPEPDGLDWWTEEIDAGRVTLAEAAVRIADGALNQDRLLFSNRTILATRITDRIKQGGKTYQFDQINLIKDFLLTVDEYVDPVGLDLSVLLNQLP